MAPRRKLTKKLYKRLRTNQVDDVCLTAFQVVEIKFYLKHHRRCHHVIIQNDLPLDYLACPLPDNLPKFISSQLEAQKIIADDSRPSVQVWSALQFISGCFSHNPSHTRSYPTLFCWRSPNKQRSYYLFAYLTCLMASKRYKMSELLELRDTPPCQILLDRVRKNPELADIVTGLKKNSTPSDNSNVTMPRRPKKIKEETSSTDGEDQVLFQGRKAPRPTVTNGDATSDPKPPRRNEPERIAHEPLSAPSGLAAQQSEGFQRFFKAVVSPTHVRVTAGGRIVPNTRSTASPTAKWDKELPNSENDTNDIGKSNSSDNQIPAPDSASCQTAPPVMAPPPMASPMYPGFPAMYPPMAGPMPFYPMANSMGFPYAMPYAPMQASAMASGSQNAMPQAQAPQQAENPTAVPKPENKQDSRKPKPAPLKLSPPDQFDQNRPFFYNGHFIYPALGSGNMQSPLSPMTPSPYLPPGFAGHPAIARVGSFAQPSSVSSLPSPHVMPTQTSMPLTTSAAIPQQVAPQGQGAPKSSASSQFPSSVKPPITSIKPSDITKVQLTSLRSQLKYYEDQLQYNKHQIDEEKTKEQIGAIRQLINQFEHNFGLQMHFETSYSGSDGKSINEASNPGAEAVPCQTPSRESSMQESDEVSVPKVPANSAASTRRGNPTLTHTQSMDQIRPRTVKERRQAAGINSSKGNDTSAALDALVARLNVAGDESKKSSPFIAPATASSFDPLRTASLSTTKPADIESNTNMVLHNDVQLERTSSLLHPQQNLWQDFGSYVAGARAPTQPGLAHHAASTSGYTSPYLVGQLPHGITQAARGIDYSYSRDLTKEEKRARHIYWGQVSIKGSGLPKFDGKDFYPPTPTKETSPRSESKVHRGLLPSGRPEVDFGYTQPKKTTGDPFQSSRDKSTGKVSHAVPIINPETLDPLDCIQTPKASSGTKTSTGPTSDQKPPSPGRRILDRSSNKSSNDLWQSMLKKGTASGVAVPSTVSSTTATGYVPPLSSHGMASLAPAFVNANGHGTRSPLAKAEQDPIGMPAEKVGENRPPQQQTLKQQDDIADLHQRMLRDAERRGVNWQ